MAKFFHTPTGSQYRSGCNKLGRWNAHRHSLVQLWCGVGLELVGLSALDRLSGEEKWPRIAEGRSHLLLYIFRSLQSIIRFDIWRISMQYTENIKGIFYSLSYNYKLRCFFAFYVYVVSIWPIEYYRLKVAFYLASQNQMIINGYNLAIFLF